MSAHTPGPWTMQPIGDETECNILGAGRELVATVSDNDAHLIAAAPLMYEELARVYTEEGSALKPETCTRLLTLLAQVQGESNV